MLFPLLSVLAVVGAVFSQIAETNTFLGKNLAESSEFANEVALQFHQFIHKFGKSYGSQAEFDKRLAIFSNNLDKARQHNSRRQSVDDVRLGVTNFMDLTEEEFADRYLGLGEEQSESNARKEIFEPKERSGAIAERKDWRDSGRISGVTKQLCSNCWSHALASLVSAVDSIRRSSSPIIYSPYHIDHCGCPIYHSFCAGYFSWRCAEIMQEQSVAFSPQTDSESVCTHESEQGEGQCKRKVYTARCFCRKHKRGEPKVKAVFHLANNATYEKAITDYVALVAPVVVSIAAKNWAFYEGGIMRAAGEQCRRKHTNHAVTVVGYVLNHTPPYYILKNSWGADWGEKGFFRLEYGKNACMVSTSSALVIKTM